MFFVVWRKEAAGDCFENAIRKFVCAVVERFQCEDRHDGRAADRLPPKTGCAEDGLLTDVGVRA